ncbi:MDR family MFS transporter [Paenibacillus pasadenensis]|uniref:Drug resistance transporter, EmrB/QacA family n=2 Tax=Paenibacillus pasadenensis TaxID=217090 RepID=A0A2N5N238_9BACL|nr:MULTISPECIES: MDR family MFS transporter [Paenibacillus]PLT44392.1 drug resistance transporter, EmrB/QacA family [Paenibacillus pasadenensis]QGG54880.1 DHA2 family efflux MFS transporter permease subunit [Paenibacillus sp. B01]
MKQATRNPVGLVIAGLLLGMLMASMDQTIVSTAMGTIVGELGGLDKFVWVTSAYMVAEMAGMPIFGKLSDMYGRKRFFVFGLIVFMIGSALCGTAASIEQLALYRAIQGLGGGAMIPVAFTIMFDAVPAEQRGKLGGLFGAVFGLSSIFGPLLGAYITDYIHWNWIFYINLPLGLISLIFVWGFYRESQKHSRQIIDWGGAATLVGAVICLIFALELGGKTIGGTTYGWDSALILGLFGGFAVLTVLFVLFELRAKEPIITFRMFRSRVYASSNLVGIFAGAAFISASMYIPIFISGVMGGKATNSGLVLLPMMVGSVVTATLGGFLMTKFKYRTLMIPTLALLVVGLALLTTIGAGTNIWVMRLFMVLVGLGIGASFSVLSNACMFSVPVQDRGAASSTLSFLRTLGMAVGITVFGIIQSHLFTRKLESALGGAAGGAQPGAAAGADAAGAAGTAGGAVAGAADGAGLPGFTLHDPRELMDPALRAQIPPDLLERITGGLSSSIVQTFAWAIVPAALALLCAFFMGNGKMDPAAVAEQEREYASAH